MCGDLLRNRRRRLARASRLRGCEKIGTGTSRPAESPGFSRCLLGASPIFFTASEATSAAARLRRSFIFAFRISKSTGFSTKSLTGSQVGSMSLLLKPSGNCWLTAVSIRTGISPHFLRMDRASSKAAAGVFRKHNVEDHGIRQAFGESSLRTGRIVGHGNFVSFGPANRSDGSRKVFVVIDNQQKGHTNLSIIQRVHLPKLPA